MNKLCFPPTKSISYVERQDLAIGRMLSSGSDCDDDDDGCDKKTIPGTSCGDSYYLLLDFGLSGIHPPAVHTGEEEEDEIEYLIENNLRKIRILSNLFKEIR